MIFLRNGFIDLDVNFVNFNLFRLLLLTYFVRFI